MKFLKTVGKSFVVAFSIYSKIPMPRFIWESDDMKYHLCFFPWVGAVIGGLEFLWYWICNSYGLGTMLATAMALAIPLLVTGGFHLDGFMDTCDALHSYQDREKKLEILKDPHIGAFAVICVVAFLLLAGGGVSALYDGGVDENTIAIVCAGFVLSRCFSGISVVTMHGAKSKGMLQTFSETAVKKTVCVLLVLQTALCAVFMMFLDWRQGAIALAACGGTYLYYWYKSKKEFGGITGDLAGYFVTLAELMICLVLAAYGMFVA